MKKVNEFIARSSAVVVAALLTPGKAFAASWFKNPIGTDTLDELISTLLNTAIIGAAIVAVVYLIYNGFKYMVSAGDESKTQEAQKGLANALIGLVVCLAAYLIVNFITGKLGYQLRSID